MCDTRVERLTRSPRRPGGMRWILAGEGEPIEVASQWRSLGTLVHLTDLHICDAQSPSRVEYYDRYADPDSPFVDEIGYVGVYRPQEALTTQVLASMIAAANRIESGPSGAPVDAVVITGDTVDNAQGNELRWYHTLLDGGSVVPDSGHPAKWEGVGGPADPDERYWHPEGGADDLPRRLHGFPTLPGFFDAVRRRVTSPGLRHRWFAIHGNHDMLLQGVTPPDAAVDALTTGDQRIVGVAEGTDVRRLILDFAPVGPATFPLVPGSPTVPVTADAERAFLAAGEYAAAHLACGDGHGFTAVNVQDSTAYWARELNQHVTLIALDTVNRHGGWHGSVDRTQFEWLQAQLDRIDSYVVLLSHHPLETLVNGYAPAGSPSPALADEVRDLLLQHPKVVLWVAGHTHRHQIEYVGPDAAQGFWHVRTSSLIDWPQQSRVIELLDAGEDLAIATYVFDHDGERIPGADALATTDGLAGVSRWLAANNWQRQEGPHVLDQLEGSQDDRNAVLRLRKR